MNVEISRQEIAILLAWSEEATKGRFGAGEEASGLTWEESNLIKKLNLASKSENI